MTALSVVIGVTAVAGVQAGCSSGGSAPSAPSSGGGEPAVQSGVGAPGSSEGSGGSTGTIGLSLTLPGGDQVNSVTYTLTSSTATTLASGTVTTSNSQSINFQIGGIPVGSGDSVRLNATSLAGAMCAGSASGINITARGSTSVIVQMLCTSPGSDAGNLYVTAATSYCGTWTSLSSGSNGSEVFVGQTITLTATATGSAPGNLGYTWSQSSDAGVIGMLGASQTEDAGTSNTNTFMCTAPGTATITVVVDDGPVPDGGSCPANLSTVTTTVVCDPNPANDGG